jgi:glycosyltransferase involved in cell wall biosynthesis
VTAILAAEAVPASSASETLRILSVGVSTTAVCGVRDYATVLAAAGAAETDIVWWQRRRPESVPATLEEMRAWFADIDAQLARRRHHAILWHYSVFVHGWRGVPLLAPLIARRLSRSGVPVVGVLHEFALPFGRGGWRAGVWATTQRSVLPLVMRRLAAAVVTTEDRLDWLQSRRWLPRRSLSFAPVFSTLPPAVGGVSRPDERALSVGVLGYGDGEFLAGEVTSAVSLLRARGIDAELVLVGGPGSASGAAERWRRAATAAGCAGALRFTGVVDPARLAAAIAGLDVVVFGDPAGPTSRKTTLAAALALGRPVIAVDGPQRWRPLVRDGAVVLAEPTAEGLAGELARLARDDQARMALGERAARFHRRYMAPQLVAGMVGEAVGAVAT